MADTIREACGPDAADFVEGGELATALMGDSIATNLFMVGYAWQKGLVPIGREAIEQAIVLNGASVDANKAAFEWGRRAAVDIAAVRKAATPADALPESQRLSESLDEAVARRRAFLVRYQNEAYALRYVSAVERVRAAEGAKAPGSTALTLAAARYLFKLMAYKDEYEVARLYTDGEFAARVASQFEGDYRLVLHLAPPMLSRTDPATGELRKRAFGPWMLRAMRVLAAFRGLRGTAFDPFGYTAERKTERADITAFEANVDRLLAGLTPDNRGLALAIARLPMEVRGFGPVKEKAREDVAKRAAALWAKWPGAALAAAA
jgi:indolepyruvate ferredoxin oxidoreductase